MKKYTADQVKTMRQKRKMNQTDFWSRVGVTQSAGSRYESGREIPDPVHMLVCIAYGNARDITKTLSRLGDFS